MNDHTFFNTFFLNHPTFICSSDGSVILANDVAEKVFNNTFVSKKLTEIISKNDKFKFEFAIHSKKPQPIIAAATLIHGYSYISFIFGKIAEKAAAIAVFSKSYEEAQELTLLANNAAIHNNLNSLAIEIVKSNVLERLTYSDFSLFDPYETIEKLICDYRSYDINLTYHGKNDASPTYYSDMGIHSFICYFTMASSAIETLSLDKNINISILPLKDSFELRLETQIRLDAYNDQFSSETLSSPKVDALLRLCDFIAGCSRCTFTVYQKKSNVILSLISAELDEATDFKSHDKFANYAVALKHATDSLEAICIEADRA